MDLPYYHGPLSKKDCEALLLQDGADGNFLLRDSESLPGVLCLCISFNRFVYTYRIFKEKPEQYSIQTTEGSRKQIFPSLKELVSRFKKPQQGLVCHLLKPFERTSPCLRWRRSKLELDENSSSDDYGDGSSDYVEVLP